MPTLIVLIIVGFFAQLVDGALGMAYGATSSSLLLAVGLSPATASASVHLAELGTTAASGVSHWRFGNVDWRTVRRIGIPGALGAFTGAVVLSSISADLAQPWMAGILLALGLLHPVSLHALRRAQAAGTALCPRALPRAPRARRGVHRRHGRRRLGARRDPDNPRNRQVRTAQGHRLRRHERVPRRAGGEHRLPPVYRESGNRLDVRRRAPDRRARGRADRSVARPPRHAVAPWRLRRRAHPRHEPAHDLRCLRHLRGCPPAGLPRPDDDLDPRAGNRRPTTQARRRAVAEP